MCGLLWGLDPQILLGLLQKIVKRRHREKDEGCDKEEEWQRDCVLCRHMRGRSNNRLISMNEGLEV